MTETPDSAVAALAVQLAALNRVLGQTHEDLETAKHELTGLRPSPPRRVFVPGCAKWAPAGSMQ